MRANLVLTQKKFVNETAALDDVEKEEMDVEYDGLCAQVVRDRIHESHYDIWFLVTQTFSSLPLVCNVRTRCLSSCSRIW